MNVALFGGTFDPIHRGHVVVARAAAERFQLREVHFVPADLPPHKQHVEITAYHHRFAMVALALREEKSFIASDIEAQPRGAEPVVNYSIDTVRRFRKTLSRSDRLFFIVGMDSFLELTTWREPEALLRESEFIIVSRPGFHLDDVGRALPESLRPDARVLKVLSRQAPDGPIAVSGVTLHVLSGVSEKASSTQLRTAITAGRSLARFLDPAVAEYIKKAGLYRAAGATAAKVARGKAKKAGGKNAGKVLEFRERKRPRREKEAR